MTQKQFIKQLMGRGVSYSDACGLVAYMKELRQLIEKHEDVVMLADANTMQFVPVKVYSYEETFQRMKEGRRHLLLKCFISRQIKKLWNARNEMIGG